MKYINLTKGKRAIVDDDDFSKVYLYKYHYDTWGYAVRSEWSAIDKRNKKVFLHRDILEPPSGLQIDHINGNKLDNRKENLRICTASENVRHRPIGVKNTSGYKGVIFSGKLNKKNPWVASINIGTGKNRKHHHLGYFSTKEDAALAYNIHAKKFFGEYAYLNNVVCK